MWEFAKENPGTTFLIFWVAAWAVTSLQVRVEKAASGIAHDVAVEAVSRINNWGSFFGNRGITKDEASRSIHEAVKWTLDKRASAIMGSQLRGDE